jgi:hypothetical protein
MFFVLVTALLLTAGLAALVAAPVAAFAYRRSWRTWLPLLIAGPLCLYGAGYLAGFPFLD